MRNGRARDQNLEARNWKLETGNWKLETRLLSALLLLEGFLQIFPSFILRTLRIVVGLQSLAVLVGRALPLSGDVEDLAQLDVTPDFGPARITVAIQGFAVSVGRGLIVVLQKEHLGHAIVGERTVLVDLQRLVELAQCSGQVALLHQRLSSQDGGTQL